MFAQSLPCCRGEVEEAVCKASRDLNFLFSRYGYVSTMFDTVYPADSVEFCPHPSALDVFVCGTYKLDEEVSAEASNCDAVARSRTQRRRGTCLVFKTTSIDGEGPGM